MSQHLMSTIHKTLLDISEQQDIPSRLLDTLERHLIIICTPYPRQPRSNSLRARRDVRSYYKQKRAQKVYLDMLDNAPQTFLPFILVVTPKACENLKAIDFYRMPTNGRRIELRHDTKLVFEDIAKRNKLNDSPHYKKLFKVLFPEFARPITTAESGGYEYHLADVQNVRMVLGDRILDFLNSKPIESGQSGHGTDCVGTCVPRNNFHDAIIYLRIGQAHELARILFPALRKQDSTAVASANGDPVRLSGASMSALASLFHFRICDAIEKSQLRLWEREHSSQEVTDCVTLEMDPVEPEHGVLRLRTDFTRGIPIVKDLYAVHQPILDVPLYM